MSKTDKTEMIRINVDIEKNKHKRLKLILVQNDKSIKDFLHEAVEKYLLENDG
jgi:hypothetical protein